MTLTEELALKQINLNGIVYNDVKEIGGGDCYFATIYQRSPVGLPIPSDLAKVKLSEPEKLNRLLQELAWQAVTEHPQSGVKAVR